MGYPQPGSVDTNFSNGNMASIAHNFFIRAYAIGEASVIAPIDYVRLLASAAVDF